MACDIPAVSVLQLIHYLSGLLSRDLIVFMIIGRSVFTVFFKQIKDSNRKKS